jgi:choice-of-anchor B domain-containing protein
MNLLKTGFFSLSILLFINAKTQDFENINLLDNWTDETLPTINNGIRFNEVWGFVQDDQEYAVIGSTMGTHIFLISDLDELIEVDFVPGAFQGGVVHRHFDDFNGYLYGVCDQGNSTLQIMDLQYLPDSVSLVYNSNEHVVTAHNCFIDRSSNILYLAGPAGDALRLLSIENPVEPTFIMNFLEVNYVHDLFVRNDTAYLNCAGQGLWVVDFSDPISPVQLGSLDTYPDQGYNHSGWLTDDGNTYVFADETTGMRMKVCDVSDLTDIQILSLFNSEATPNTVPHNLQIKGDLVYVSHYNDGLQIFDISNPSSPARVAYYDTFYGDDSYAFNGAWGVYAFLPSGRILISDRTSGLYLFEMEIPLSAGINKKEPEITLFPNPCIDVLNLNSSEIVEHLTIYDLTGKIVMQQSPNANALQIDMSNLPSSIYVVEVITGQSTTRNNVIRF